MKGFLSGLSALLILMTFGCTPSPNEDPGELYEDLVALNPPEDQSTTEDSQVYIDSISVINVEDHPVLAIHGNFPDGCTSLESAEHSTNQDTLNISLSAWRNPDLMCSQALTKFTFMYDKLGDRELSDFSTVIVNGTTFNF